MSLTDRCQLALAEIARRRAVIAKATDAPWQSDPEEGVYNASVRCGMSEPWTGDFVASVLKESDATFIAASRNERDGELAGLATAIEGLSEQRNYLEQSMCGCVVANEAGDRDICGRCIAMDECEQRLITLCDQLGIPL